MYINKNHRQTNKIAQLREDFSYAMIHDMKTPLSSITMCTSFLHSGRLDDKPEMKEKYFTIVENEADHLLALTNKILTLSKLENHKLEMNKKKISFEPIIEDLKEKFITKSDKPIHFTIDLKAKEVYVDEEFFKELMSNLIDNAIKYSKKSIEIKISSHYDNKYTIIKYMITEWVSQRKIKEPFSTSLNVLQQLNALNLVELPDLD
mgnify:CR=1 FL=1